MKMTEILNITSHTSGAVERICILEAQEDKHRDRGKQEVPPAYRELRHPQPFTALP